MKFSEALRVFAEIGERDYAARTIELYLDHLGRFSKWLEIHVGHDPEIESLRVRGEILEYIRFLEKKGVADNTVNLSMVALRRMWKMLHGLERELGIQLPFLWSVIPIKKGITAKSHRAWRPEEFYAMLDAVQGVPGFLITRDIAILMTLFHGAMRVSELTALNVSSIDPEQLAIDTITRKRRGRQVMRRIYVPRECMIAILTYLDIRQHFSGNDALFIDFRTGKRLCVRTIERVVKQFAIRANLNPAWFKPHGGRHGWGRRAGETEMYLPHIKSQLGHKSLAGSEVYINTTNTALKRGVHEKMETEVAWRHHINPVELEKKWPKKNVAAQIEKLLKVAPPKK